MSVSYGEYRCSLDTRFYTGDPHQYVAYVSAVGNYETDVQATSNPVTVARKPWSATLTVDRSVFAAGQSYTLKATADQNVANTGGFYSLYIVDIGTGEVVKECTTGTSCSLTTKFYTGDPRSYRAFVASRPDGHEVDRQVATNSVNVARQAWQVSLDTVSEATPDSNGMVKTTFRATTNQNIGYTNSNYRTYIYDVTASRSIAICTSGTTCTGSTNFPEGNPHRVIAYVAGIGNPWVDQQAKSNAITAQAGGGAVIAGEVFGGANPAEACASTCRADPVNTQSGEFFETTTDIGLPGVGPNVSWTRTYSAQRAGTPGAFGYGWTASVGMAVESADTDPLALAQAVNVVQENGSLTRFIRTEDGTFEAPDRVFATLTYDPVDGYRYVRGGNEVFLFTPQGALTRIEDNNGNGMDVTVNASGQVTGLTADDGRALTVTYANGRVTRVEDSTGREATYTYDAAGDLTSVNGFGGTVSTYAYDANHRVVSMTKPGGAVTTNTYDADGRVIEQVDPIGRSTNFEYLAGETRVTDNLGVVTIERYSNGQLTSMTSAAGTPAEATVSYTYTSSNQVASMTDALGRVAYYSYDARGNRVWIINTLGAMTKFAYDENGHLVTVTNALNQVTTFENDAKGNPVAVTDALGNRTVNTLNEKGQVIAVTDALGRTSTVEHDAHGRPIAQVSPGGVRTEIEYDALGLVTATVDPRGTQPGDSRDDYRSTYAYNALGLRTSATDPLGNSMSYSYDNAGRTTSTTDALGHATTLTYDAAGQILTSTDASGATTSFAYDGVGRVTAVTAPDGSTVSTVYDAAGRPTQSIDALGNATSYTYDAAGQLLTETSPEGRVTTYAYDAGGNVKKVTDPAGGITTMAYDLLGRVTSVTDPDGRTTMTTYDAAGRVVQTRRSDGATEGYVYDAAGQVTSSTDVNGRVTTYAYDADGNVVSSVDFAGRTTSATYVDGFPVVTTDAAGETTTTSYDVRGLATGVTYSSGLAPSAMVYDALGRVTSATDGAGQTDYTYDVLGRVTAIEGPTGDVGYAYNAAGNVASVTYPGGRVVERTYDAAGRVTGFESDGVGAFGVVWTADGLVDAVTYPNGVATDYTYDLAGRATDISVTGSAGAVLELGYAYTPGSLMSSRTTARDGGVAVSEDVTWDAAARLSTISSMSSGVPVQYTPSSEVMRADDGALLAWGADGSLTSRTVGAEVTAYASDGLGRRTSTTTASGDSTSFGWDQVGRMTGLADTVTGSVTDYSYSGGLRVGAATTVGGDTSTEAFTWDTLAGVPLLLSDSTHEYIYGLGTAPVAQVDTTTGEVVFLHGDLIGSTRSATDVSGAQVGSWDYSVFGETLTATGGAAGDGAGITRFLFAGEYLDDTGLYYLRARFYDPVTASFLSVDPALSATGSPYAYASGNPLQLVDPLGLWSMPNPFDSAINSISNTVKSLTSWGSVSDLLGTVACEVSGGFFWPDTGRNINLMLGFANHAKDELRETWREVRYFMNIKNPVSAIPAEAAMNVAVRSGAECEWESTEKFWVCYGADAGYVPDSGGTMYGAVFVTPWSKAELEKKDREQNRSTIRHEAKHGDIEAFIGSPGVGVLVLASGINNTALDLVIRQDPMGTARNVGKLFKCNGVEWSAGYQDGGYEECV
ncbi:DUF6531 domain-containing protein [Demequina sp. TTPB684]|nr:DUF6531 domain-containing protein [Demequina sp. TTPB684]